MTSTPNPIHTGKIEENDLTSLLTHLEFILDRGEANASTYELIGHGLHRSLIHHYRLLLPMRPSEKLALGFNPPTSTTLPRHGYSLVWVLLPDGSCHGDYGRRRSKLHDAKDRRVDSILR